jgi:hypothetical protein
MGIRRSRCAFRTQGKVVSAVSSVCSEDAHEGKLESTTTGMGKSKDWETCKFVHIPPTHRLPGSHRWANETANRETVDTTARAIPKNCDANCQYLRALVCPSGQLKRHYYDFLPT